MGHKPYKCRGRSNTAGLRFFLSVWRSIILHDCSIKAAAKYLRLTWDEMDHIKAKAVARGRRRKGTVETSTIGIDKKSVGRGPDYVTVVLKLKESGPLVHYIGDSRDEHVLDAFWEGPDESVLKRIRSVSMDMWKPYIQSVKTHLPAGKNAITHDPFHIVKHMNEAVDAVRRQEIQLLPESEKQTLKGTRYMWLYGFENLPEEWEQRIRDLKHSKLKTARAWRLKETLRAMYQAETWAQAETFFRTWHREALRSQLEPVKRVARMIKEHLPQVQNYFIHRITNAYSEGVNSTIQALIKRVNGYRQRERLKRDLFFHLEGLDLYPSLPQ